MGDESWERKRSASVQPTECTKFVVSNEKWEQIFASLKRKKTESHMDGRFFSPYLSSVFQGDWFALQHGKRKYYFSRSSGNLMT